jgi:hypothetical protein
MGQPKSDYYSAVKTLEYCASNLSDPADEEFVKNACSIIVHEHIA